MSFTFHGIIQFNWDSFAVASLKAPSMIVFDEKTKVLDTEIFWQYIITDLNSGFTFIVLFSQEKSFQSRNINKHTTHTHTHSERKEVLMLKMLKKIKYIHGVLDQKMEKCYQFRLVRAINTQTLVKKLGRCFGTISTQIAEYHGNIKIYIITFKTQQRVPVWPSQILHVFSNIWN